MSWFFGALVLLLVVTVARFALGSRNGTPAGRPRRPLRPLPAPAARAADEPGPLRWTKVVGVTRGDGQRLIERAARRGGGDLSLRREAENPHDRNAVRVRLDGHAVGWLPREVAAEVAPILDGAGNGGGSVTPVRTEFVGGGDGRNWGIRLQLRLDDRGVHAAAIGRLGNLGPNLRRIRKERGLTQTALAEKSGVPAADISAIENRWYERRRRMTPTDETIRNLAEALAVPPGDLRAAGEAAAPSGLRAAADAVRPSDRRAAGEAVAAGDLRSAGKHDR